MEWFKQYTSDGTDPRLETLTDAQHRTWFRMECLAGKIGGVIAAKPARLLALEVAGRDVALLEATVAALVELEWVEVEEDGAIAFIDRRRFTRKPSDQPEATRERKAKSRAELKQSEDVTLRHAPVTRDMSSHAIEREKEEREKTERGDRAEAREASPLLQEADAAIGEQAPPVPGKPKGAGHPFTDAQLDRIKAAFPPGQLWSPQGMHHKIRHELSAYVEKGELEHTVLADWAALETELKVAWFEEGMRRALVEDTKPVWRVAYAAKQMGRALQNGLDLFKDGWAPRQKGAGKITQLHGRQERGSVTQGAAVVNDMPAAEAELKAAAIKLSTVDGKHRADLEACSGVRQLVTKGSLPATALDKALANRGLTLAELDAYDAQKGQEVAHG